MNLFNRKQDTDKSSKKLKSESMENRNEKLLEKLKVAIDETEAVLIGAGSGLSASAGFTYSGERFEKHFSGFIKKAEFEIRLIFCIIYSCLTNISFKIN